MIIGALYQRDDLDPQDPLARVQVIDRDATSYHYSVLDRWDDVQKLSLEELFGRYRQVSGPLPTYPRFRALKGGG